VVGVWWWGGVFHSSSKTVLIESSLGD